MDFKGENMKKLNEIGGMIIYSNFLIKYLQQILKLGHYIWEYD